MNVQVTLLGVQSYSFQDKESGRQVEGTNCFFIEQAPANTDNKAGFVPNKATLPVEAFNDLKKLSFPCDCEAVVSTEFSNKGVRSKVTNFKPLVTK